jgi:hypothetical protein
MGIVKGLKDLNKTMDKSHDSDASKARWVKLADGESVKIRFLQELDPDSPNYNEKNGLGFIAVEHATPGQYKRKALCSMDDQGKCYACEQHRKDYKKGWKGKSRLYINVLVDDGKEEPYVAILSQGASGKAVTPTLIEYAGEMGSITDLVWRIKRSGDGTETSYTIISLAKDDKPFDSSGLELYKLEEVAVRDLPYADQEAFYEPKDGEKDSSDEEDSATSSNQDW